MKNMGNAEVTQRGKRWYVTRNGDFVGRYSTEAEAIKAAEIVLNSDRWPPNSGCERIRWRSGKWEFRAYGVCCRDVDLAAVIKYRDKRTNVAKRKSEKPKIGNGSSGCAKCVWRLSLSGGEKGQNRYHCGYSLCLGHHSRIYLHYQRTGKQSLEGFTSGTGCTEFMAGNPRDKLSLMQDDPANVTEKAWALLGKEGVITRADAKTSATRKPYNLTTDMDMEKAKALKSRYTWREIATAAGLSVNGAKGSWERQRINRQAAKRLLDAYGIDITK
jgi:hypothetical protein|nr:MAG TPA: hypothetical protein [Caudoviricetes sp.]